MYRLLFAVFGSCLTMSIPTSSNDSVGWSSGLTELSVGAAFYFMLLIVVCKHASLSILSIFQLAKHIRLETEGTSMRALSWFLRESPLSFQVSKVVALISEAKFFFSLTVSFEYKHDSDAYPTLSSIRLLEGNWQTHSQAFFVLSSCRTRSAKVLFSPLPISMRLTSHHASHWASHRLRSALPQRLRISLSFSTLRFSSNAWLLNFKPDSEVLAFKTVDVSGLSFVLWLTTVSSHSCSKYVSLSSWVSSDSLSVDSILFLWRSTLLSSMPYLRRCISLRSFDNSEDFQLVCAFQKILESNFFHRDSFRIFAGLMYLLLLRIFCRTLNRTPCSGPH